MRIASFEWDGANEFHALRHGVSREEIEEAIIHASLIRKARSGAYLAYGQTLDGRFVLVVFDYKGRGKVRPFSARPLTDTEKKRLRRPHS
jgi:uncharacterized DUF497 family protein